ncbi:MAG: hypothetical protein COA65_09000 [Rhodospirillaceae bacterium]|nr:MAG: hypothetical protein COA65_09000 [Rhodospirillaceae bacterium]
MAIRKKLKAPAFEDMSIKEAEALLAQVGEQQRLVGVIEATRDNHLTAIKKKASEELAPLRKNLTAMTKRLTMWGEKHRAEICRAGSKTAVLSTGELIWRLDPTKVSIKDSAAVMKRLKELRLNLFIRIRESIDKEAMLKDREKAEAVEGVTFVQSEQLEVRPLESKPETAGDKVS